MASYPALDLRLPRPNTDRGVRLQPDRRGLDAATLPDLLYAELDAFAPLAIHEDDSNDTWRVFFRTGAERDAAGAALLAAFGDRIAGVSPVEVDDEDWARRSQASLKAIRAGRIVVAPPWDTGSGTRDSGSGTESRDILIVIEPSMGFGTGHHATTRLCLQLLQTIDVRGLRAIDVGTGSGVLAIAARMLGASGVAAIDHDPDALQNARDNIERNGLTGTIEVIEADLAGVPVHSGTADVLLANLTGAVLQRYARMLAAMVRPGAALIVSGFSPAEFDAVVSAFGMPVERRLEEGEWVAARLVSSA